MKTYKIKLEDKAAFMNKLDKAEVPVDSNEFEDNKLEGYFTFTTSDPKTIEVIKTILKQSPKINDIKERRITVNELRVIVKEELKRAWKGK